MSRFAYVLYGIFILVIFTIVNIEKADDDNNHYNYNGRTGAFSGGHK